MITSTNNNTIKTLIKLKQKKYRNQFGYYLIEGEHLVNEALKANQVECIITTKPLKSNLEVIEVSEEVMAKLAFTKSPSNIMAKCKIDSNNELMMKKRYLILDD